MGIVGLRALHLSRRSSSPLSSRAGEFSKGIIELGASRINA